ncbi:hypothetical protein CK203_088028 [Vitis vinifera]|uniref:Uncharacterized protein n=1 Tax=Vitis vinifera TaxID=29760 RepID=A0A438ER52_VITVI|nr:hypothetical protein CK203_088028 [Vitis vinifera]
MSLGYAEKLSYIEDVGKVGMSEIFDPLHVLQEKVKIFSPIPSFLSYFLAYPSTLSCFVLESWRKCGAIVRGET